ncbi:hypothetical protein LP419_38640 [Massilia sp. H-1]|nr:hypothetical protein LP419_38640 [Massilia sp. H-1]
MSARSASTTTAPQASMACAAFIERKIIMALGDGIRRNITTVSEEERNLFVAAIRQLDSGSMVYPNNLGHEGADGA